MGSGISSNKVEAPQQRNNALSRKASNRFWSGKQLIIYKNGEPAVHADVVYPCFNTTNKKNVYEELPGYLFRLVNNSLRQWFYYNDTKHCHMIVTGYFGPQSQIKALGKARMFREMPSALLIVELIIAPLTTEPYIEIAFMQGYDLKYKIIRDKDEDMSNNNEFTTISSSNSLTYNNNNNNNNNSNIISNSNNNSITYTNVSRDL